MFLYNYLKQIEFKMLRNKQVNGILEAKTATDYIFWKKKGSLISHSTTTAQMFKLFYMKYYDVVKEDYKGLTVVYVYACAAHCMQTVKQFYLVIDIFLLIVRL